DRARSARRDRLARRRWSRRKGRQLLSLRSWFSTEPLLYPVKIEIHNRSCEECQSLAHDESADNRDAERPAQLRTHARAQGEWQSTKKGGHSGHHDWPETVQARVINRLERTLAAAFGLEREVDHHNCVLFYQADQQNDADHAHHVQLAARQQQ